MRFISVPILILLIISQSFNHWFVVLSFKMNQDYIAKNLCENRFRPKLNCKGNCVLMKRLKQQEKEEQQSPAGVKIEVSAIVISSRSFFATLNYPVAIISRNYLPLFNTGKPVDRSFAMFHPPGIAVC